MRSWYSAQELAGLPGLPGTARNVKAMAAREHWEGQSRLGSKAIEYAFANLPKITQAALIAASVQTVEPLPVAVSKPITVKSDAVLASRLSEDQRSVMTARLAFVREIERMSQSISQQRAIDTLVADAQASMVYSTIFPDSGEGLADWERVLALPDPCLVGQAQTVGQRVQAVISKLQGRAGQSKPFFIALAKSMGYDITITTFRPASVGLSRAGDPLNGGDWNFTWRVNAPAVTTSHARVGITGAGDPLTSWGNKSLECRLGQLKPAESILLFGYGDN